jgi:hypothetical protein
MSHPPSLLLALSLAGCAAMSAPPDVFPAVVEVSAGPNEGGSPSGFAPQRPVDRAPDPIQAVSGPRVQIGAPIAEPSLVGSSELDGVIAELNYNAGHLERCWEARAAFVPAGGEISIHAHIDPNGAVVGQCVGEDTVGDAEVVRCVNDVIAMGRYPAGRTGNLDVTFPLAFSKPNG